MTQVTDCYPFKTELSPCADQRPPCAPDLGGWSILLVNLRHRAFPAAMLSPRRRRRIRTHVARWHEEITHYGWTLHPYLHGGRPPWLTTRCFSPAQALSPSTHDALFGPAASFEPERCQSAATERAAIGARLDPAQPQCPHRQPVLLTRRQDAGPLSLDGQLEVCDREGDGWRGRWRFRIAWADLWLFPDGHDLPELTQGFQRVARSRHPLANALLAFKVEPLVVVGRSGDEQGFRVGDLAGLNRRLRDLDLSDRNGALVRRAGSQAAPGNLWQAVLRDWLGVELDEDERLLLASEDRHRRPGNLLRLMPGDVVFGDRYSDYARVLTAARIPPPDQPASAGPMESDSPVTPAGAESADVVGGCERGWNIPEVEPPLNAGRIAAEQAEGRWSPEQTAIVQARAAGYATLGDALLYELASTTDAGGALGLDGQRGWCISTEYLRNLFAESGIDIWADWKGLALRDCCAFLAWHPSMPIIAQAEARYYPLYLHSYYTQLRLHDFSEAIIERELTDLRRARAIRHAFMQFRNQFWFREPTTRFQGIEVADAMRAGMGLDALFESVASEVEVVGGYVDEKANAGRQQLIALLVLLLWPIGLLLDLSKDEIEEFAESLGPWQLGGLSVGLVGASAMLYALLAERVGRWLTRVGDWLRRRGL